MDPTAVSRWITIVDGLVPPPPGDEVTVFRHRFTVVACALGALIAVLTSATFTLAGDGAAGLTNGCYAALTVLPLVALRWRAPSSVAFWYQQIITALTFDFLAWTSRPLDWSIPMWLAVLPLTAILYGGARSGLASALLAAVSFWAMRGAPPFEWTGAPAHEASSTARFVSFLCAAALIAWLFDSLRRAAIRRAEASATARTLFLAGVSHELRTPLNAIVGLAEVLRLSEPREEQKGQLELLERSAQALIGLINDILDFARIESGRLALERISFDPRALAHDLERLFEPAAQRAGLGLAISVEEGVPAFLLGDPARVRQVLTNLLENAVKFTQRGRVDLTMRRRGSSLEVSVNDTGIGMDAATVARVFAPFEQADASYTRRYGGTGLGLAISRHLAERMGGTLEVISAPNEGSTFTFSCPLEEGTPPPPRGLGGSIGSAALEGLSVLVVDDNATNRLVAELLLRRAGCETHVADSGRQALALVAERHVDLVLMDCHMPGLDGFEATQRIRALSGPERDVVVVAMTASALPEEIDRCRASGMNGCLTKPFTFEAMIAALSACLAPGLAGYRPTADAP
ncbi:MAG: response regulator [Deltaproteobacteria bacterium]|nr:response regulator [Deltaproteobacteria bacterium]